VNLEKPTEKSFIRFLLCFPFSCFFSAIELFQHRLFRHFSLLRLHELLLYFQLRFSQVIDYHQASRLVVAKSEIVTLSFELYRVLLCYVTFVLQGLHFTTRRSNLPRPCDDFPLIFCLVPGCCYFDVQCCGGLFLTLSLCVLCANGLLLW
jgi:hypothetical protein